MNNQMYSFKVKFFGLFFEIFLTVESIH